MSKTQIKLEKFQKALLALETIYLKPAGEDRANIDATIQRFEFTFELSWKFLKDYFFDRGIALNYPKEVLAEAYSAGLIQDELLWVKMLSDRNMTSHTYDEKLADEIHLRIRQYVPALKQLLAKIQNT